VVGPRHQSYGVVTEASRALGFSKIRDYAVPNWFAGFYGVPGTLLKRKVQSHMSDFDRARTLLVRLNYLIDFYIGEGSKNPHPISKRPLRVFRVFRHALQVFGLGGAEHVYRAQRDYISLKWQLRATLEEFVNLPLSELRSARSIKGPCCLACLHVSCGDTFWSRQGRPPLTGRRSSDNVSYRRIHTGSSGVG